MRRKDASGFSLIELMIVVAIIAILAAIAYPSYQEQVRKSRRADCEGALTGFAGALERHYTTTNSYCDAGTTAAANCGTATGDTGAPTIFPTQCPIDGSNKTYDLTISAVTANSYTIRAAPIGPQTNDKCGTLTLDETGAKGQGGGHTVNECW